MPYEDITNQHEQIRRNEFLFNDLIERYAPDPEVGNYLGNEFQAYEPDVSIAGVRFVSVEEANVTTKYIDIRILLGERTIVPFRVNMDDDTDLSLYLGESRLDPDPLAVGDMLQQVTDLAEADALEPVDESDDSIFDAHIAPDFVR